MDSFPTTATTTSSALASSVPDVLVNAASPLTDSMTLPFHVWINITWALGSLCLTVIGFLVGSAVARKRDGHTHRLLLASTRQHESEFSNIDVTSDTFSAEPLSIYCHKPSIPSTVCETGVIPQPVSSEKRCQRSPSLKSFSSHLSVHHAPKPIRPDTLWIQEDNAKSRPNSFTPSPSEWQWEDTLPAFRGRCNQLQIPTNTDRKTTAQFYRKQVLNRLPTADAALQHLGSSCKEPVRTTFSSPASVKLPSSCPAFPVLEEEEVNSVAHRDEAGYCRPMDDISERPYATCRPPSGPALPGEEPPPGPPVRRYTHSQQRLLQQNDLRSKRRTSLPEQRESIAGARGPSIVPMGHI